MSAVIEDVHPSIGYDSLAARVRATNDELDVEINTLFFVPASPILLGDNTYPCDAPQQPQVVPFEAEYTVEDSVPATLAFVAGDRFEICRTMGPPRRIRVHQYFSLRTPLCARDKRHTVTTGDTSWIPKGCQHTPSTGD